MRLPDDRYTAHLENCGHDEPMYVPRFCGEMFSLECTGKQAPPCATKEDAIAHCLVHEDERDVSNLTVAQDLAFAIEGCNVSMRKVYLDYVNNFLTPKAFGEHYGLSENTAENCIRFWGMVYEEYVRAYKQVTL